MRRSTLPERIVGDIGPSNLPADYTITTVNHDRQLSGRQVQLNIDALDDENKIHP